MNWRCLQLNVEQFKYLVYPYKQQERKEYVFYSSYNKVENWSLLNDKDTISKCLSVQPFLPKLLWNRHYTETDDKAILLYKNLFFTINFIA